MLMKGFYVTLCFGKYICTQKPVIYSFRCWFLSLLVLFFTLNISCPKWEVKNKKYFCPNIDKIVPIVYDININSRGEVYEEEKCS